MTDQPSELQDDVQPLVESSGGLVAGLRSIFAGRAAIDFRPKWRVALSVSAVLLVGSILLLSLRWLNLSIDFEGGGVWEVPVGDDVTVADARNVLPGSADQAKIQLVRGADSGILLRVQAGTESVDDSAEIAASLAELAGTDVDEVATSTIGPTWGEQITRQALAALAWFFLAVALYLAWRLEWRMAIGALAAVVHDLLITAGVYSLFGFEVSPATVIALLTILGYSLYDTVVVFDKVLENQEGPVRGQAGRRRPGQPVDEPGADAVDQHHDHHGPARPVDAGHRRRVPRRAPPSARLRPRPVHRPHPRHLLVDLRGRPDPRLAEGTGHVDPRPAGRPRSRPSAGDQGRHELEDDSARFIEDRERQHWSAPGAAHPDLARTQHAGGRARRAGSEFGSRPRGWGILDGFGKPPGRPVIHRPSGDVHPPRRCS